MSLVKNRQRFLLLIVFIAIVLRVFNLARLPAILNRDEAALAYNGYLLKETAMDEWQVKWPFALKSFGDYKLPVYPYFLGVLFRFLPPSDFVVRLPSVLAGLILVFLAYFWAKDIFKTQEKTALNFAFLIAILPIFSFYSRIAFEANLALSFFVASLYFLFKEKRQVLLAWILMLLAVLTYNTPLLLLPFIILALIFWLGPKKIKEYFAPALSLTVLFLLVFIKLLPLTTQKSGISIFSDSGVWESYALYRQGFTGFWQKVLGNQYIYYLQVMAKNLFNSFSLKFLVISGGSHPWHSLPMWGHIFYSIYFLGLLGLILSMIKIFNKKTKIKERKKLLLVLYFLIVSLAPSVITVDSPHATRSLFFFFNFTFLASLAIEKIIIFFKKEGLIYLFVLVFILEGCLYYQKYFLEYPKQQPSSLWTNYQELVKKIK